MQPIDWFFRQAWRWACDLPEEKPRAPTPDLETLRRTQWSDDFERLMRNRLLMGAFRYGTFEEQSAGRVYNNAASIERHTAAYIATGNAEHLVDIANLALCEFVNPFHANYHFQAIDDGDHHAERGSMMQPSWQSEPKPEVQRELIA